MDQTRKEKFEVEKKEAYEAIGEFVVQFEHLSWAMKNKIRHITGMSKAIDILLEPYTFRQTIDVLKKLIYLNTKDWSPKHPDHEMYNQLIKDLNILNNDRNSLVHSTWFIGWASDQTETLSEFDGQRFNGSFKSSSTADVQQLIKKCTNLHRVFWTSWSIDFYKVGKDFVLADIYDRSEDGFWIRTDI